MDVSDAFLSLPGIFWLPLSKVLAAPGPTLSIANTLSLLNTEPEAKVQPVALVPVTPS